ncbi:hypothetical protein BDK51DRAFT_48561 [Blyttiomyces helicus]|uniref:Uncharacterized protein n=1 Tax=Blyttiomyces helicus TaxID=388810 RepID=A0A4P9WUM2_9FUNG|nr:hypothetical protein BDK51DRAFT_48561 [Blyttiomyces helicus]|eukprot:RKO94816.1 hypothetical protein BDK51DRAFT_48561 [Blyttiomyces helicus]
MSSVVSIELQLLDDHVEVVKVKWFGGGVGGSAAGGALSFSKSQSSAILTFVHTMNSSAISPRTFCVAFVKYPSAVNEVSPDNPHPPSVSPTSGFRSIDATIIRGNLKNVRMHIGYVYSIYGENSLATVFLSSANPKFPHRFAPKGARTPRRPNEPPPIIPTPEDSFDELPGYLNFTHPVRLRPVPLPLNGGPVRILTIRPPGHAILAVTGALLPRPISLSASQHEYLTTLHDGYWRGDRFSDDDALPPNPGGGLDGDGDANEGGLLDSSDSVFLPSEATFGGADDLEEDEHREEAGAQEGGNVGPAEVDLFAMRTLAPGQTWANLVAQTLGPFIADDETEDDTDDDTTPVYEAFLLPLVSSSSDCTPLERSELIGLVQDALTAF